METKYTVRFYLYAGKNEQNDQKKIYVRITVRRLSAEIATTHSVNPNEWDDTRQRCKKNSLINEDLDRIKYKIAQAKNALEAQEKVVTAKAIKDYFNGGDKFNIKLQDYYAEFLSEIVSSPSIENSTKVTYQRTFKKVKEFLEAKKMKNILLREVDLQFIHSFDAYLKTLVSAQYKKPLQESYIFKTHEQFRAVLNRAVEYEYINRNPYNKGFKIKRNVARERAILTWTEIDKMQEHTLGDNAHLQKVRDLFLFCCFVGLRFSDLKKLKKSEFLTFGKRVWLQIVQKKTKTPLFVPLFEPAKQIYQKYLKLYKSNSEDLFFNSVPNNGELNASIKSIAKIVGIEKHLTWHSSRHTFATTVNMEFNKGNFEDTSKLLGQSGLDTVQIYAKLTRERLDDVADEFDKRYKERQKKKKGGKRDKGENSNDDNNPKD